MACFRVNFKHYLTRQVIDGGILSKQTMLLNFQILLTSGTRNYSRNYLQLLQYYKQTLQLPVRLYTHIFRGHVAQMFLFYHTQENSIR